MVCLLHRHNSTETNSLKTNKKGHYWMNMLSKRTSCMRKNNAVVCTHWLSGPQWEPETEDDIKSWNVVLFHLLIGWKLNLENLKVCDPPLSFIPTSVFHLYQALYYIFWGLGAITKPAWLFFLTFSQLSLREGPAIILIFFFLLCHKLHVCTLDVLWNKVKVTGIPSLQNCDSWSDN